MKKQEIKGLSAFELLEGLDDDMILSASLPEAVPVATPTVGERITTFFARMGKGGMAAAITGIVVAVAVLVGIALTRPPVDIDPPDTDPSHGIHGSLPDTDHGIIAPPLTQNPEQEKGPVAVISDGITVYPRRYDVAGNCYEITDEGEKLVWSEGGGIYPMEDIYKALPVLMTAGGTFSQTVPADHGMGRVRVFDSQFQELAEPTSIEELSQLENGTYYVQQLASIKRWNSETEYVVNTLQYAFCLIVDRSLNHTAPVRVIHGGKTYFPTGHLLEESYYDAELKKEVVKQYDGATYRLGELIPDMVTATLHYTGSITPEGALSLYLAPFYELKEITVYDGDLNELTKAQSAEPLEILCSWKPGDYYVIITAVFLGTGETSVTEFPIHIKVVEEREEESTPAGDVGETPEPPRLTVSTGWGSLYFGSKSHSREYHEGYMLWTEQWYDGGMISGDGFGATGQLSEIADSLLTIDHDVGSPVNIRLPYSEDTLTRVGVYDEQLELVDSGKDAAFLATLPMGTYIIVLTVETKGDYVPEADTYERTCTEYAFWLRAEISGSTEPIS